MIYLEKESDNHPLPIWAYEETLEYYLKTRKNYDKPKTRNRKKRR